MIITLEISVVVCLIAGHPWFTSRAVCTPCCLSCSVWCSLSLTSSVPACLSSSFLRSVADTVKPISQLVVFQTWSQKHMLAFNHEKGLALIYHEILEYDRPTKQNTNIFTDFPPTYSRPYSDKVILTNIFRYKNV